MAPTTRARLPVVCALLIAVVALPACARMPVEIDWDAQASRPDANRLVNADFAAQEESLPMGQYTTEEDIALGCVYLASDAAARVTGTDLNISAGLSIRV